MGDDRLFRGLELRTFPTGPDCTLVAFAAQNLLDDTHFLAHCTARIPINGLIELILVTCLPAGRIGEAQMQAGDQFVNVLQPPGRPCNKTRASATSWS